MALQNAQTLAVQLEFVRPALPVLYERDDTFFSQIKKSESHIVSSRAARIPLQTAPGGSFGATSADGGDMGRGSGTAYDFGQLSPIMLRMAVEVTKEVEYVTGTAEQAIANLAKQQVTDAMAQFRRDIDASLQTAGNGVFGTVSSVNGTTITLANTPFGARLLRAGQKVQVYDSTLTTNRGSMTIQGDPQNGLGLTQTITVDAVPGGTTGTDYIVVDGVSGASPVFLYGIPYHQNNATSGSWMGISRTNPYAVANAVNLANAGLTVPPVRLLLNQVQQQQGIQDNDRKVWHMHPAQRAAYEEQGLAVSIMNQDKGQDKSLDLLFAKDRITLAGRKIIDNIHADTTRVDLIDFDTWGRVQWMDIDYYRIGGNTVFPIYGVSGGLASAYIFYLVTAFQTFLTNPKAIGYVYNAALPQGY